MDSLLQRRKYFCGFQLSKWKLPMALGYRRQRYAGKGFLWILRIYGSGHLRLRKRHFDDSRLCEQPSATASDSAATT